MLLSEETLLADWKVALRVASTGVAPFSLYQYAVT